MKVILLDFWSKTWVTPSASSNFLNCIFQRYSSLSKFIIFLSPEETKMLDIISVWWQAIMIANIKKNIKVPYITIIILIITVFNIICYKGIFFYKGMMTLFLRDDDDDGSALHLCKWFASTFLMPHITKKNWIIVVQKSCHFTHTEQLIKFPDFSFIHEFLFLSKMSK